MTVLESDEHEIILNHPYGKYLLEKDYKVLSPHLYQSDDHASVTASVLLGPNLVAKDPLVLIKRSSHLAPDTEKFSNIRVFYHLGGGLCGHKGIIHGGILATLLDESLCRCAFPILPHQQGVTASLTVNYRAPAKADNFFVLKAWIDEIEGRKAWVKGQFELLNNYSDEEDSPDNVVLAEAECLVIEPRWAENLKPKAEPKESTVDIQ